MPRAIYENVDIVFIEIYHMVFIKYFESAFFLKVIHFGLKKL
jgi:hypothetical protein